MQQPVGGQAPELTVEPLGTMGDYSLPTAPQLLPTDGKLLPGSEGGPLPSVEKGELIPTVPTTTPSPPVDHTYPGNSLGNNQQLPELSTPRPFSPPQKQSSEDNSEEMSPERQPQTVYVSSLGELSTDANSGFDINKSVFITSRDEVKQQQAQAEQKRAEDFLEEQVAFISQSINRNGLVRSKTGSNRFLPRLIASNVIVPFPKGFQRTQSRTGNYQQQQQPTGQFPSQQFSYPALAQLNAVLSSVGRKDSSIGLTTPVAGTNYNQLAVLQEIAGFGQGEEVVPQQTNYWLNAKENLAEGDGNVKQKFTYPPEKGVSRKEKFWGEKLKGKVIC